MLYQYQAIMPKIIPFLKILIHRGRETARIKAVKNLMHLRYSLRGFYARELYMSEQCFSDRSSNSASPQKIKTLSPANLGGQKGGQRLFLGLMST